MLTSRVASSGFTLVELLVGMALLGILLAMGLPAFSNYMGNAKIRAAAANFHAAVQYARTESIRRNGGVEIILTDDAPVEGNVNTNNLSDTGRHWMVRSLVAGTTDTFTLLQAKSAQEGGVRSGGVGVVVTGTTSRVAFNGLGGTSVGAVARFAFTSPGAGACTDASGTGPMRCLDVRVSTTGQARLCDPVVAAGDSRACN